LLSAVALALAIPASAEWKEKVLYSFQGGADGAGPAGGVVFGPDGSLYGATQFGGADDCSPMADCGTVFQVTPQKDGSWTETVLYVFKGKASNDGEYPEGGLIADSAGNLYGTTAYGGTGNCVLLGITGGCGTVYELSPPQQKGGAWTETILYSFPTAKQGYVPDGNLVFDSAGNLYGATTYGGGKGTTCDEFYGGQCGMAFELSPPKKGGAWTEKVLHNFASGTDGANPNGGLALDGKGNVYGTTFGGGTEGGECGSGGCGTAFELKPPSKRSGAWTEQILYRFSVQDGAAPAAGVVFGPNNDLYGTAEGGGTNGDGAVFSLSAPKGGSRLWKETLLYRFSDGSDGANPMAGLVFDAHGDLYGTAYRGHGGSQYGDVFRLRPRGKRGPWALSVLYGFSGSLDAAQPNASLVFDRSGNLYSTSPLGGTGTGCGTGGCGTVYEVSP
jgi:uncharacterized repeat protein (TIGR03803 family)